MPGVRIVGDLTGIPLLKFSAKSAAEAVHAIAQEKRRARADETLELAIIGAGVAGVSAAIEAKKAGIRFRIFEATETFSTVANFPKRKPIYTYPTELKLNKGLTFSAEHKEELLAEMEVQRRAAEIVVETARAEKVRRAGDLLEVCMSDKAIVRARHVIECAWGRAG
jgi:thioredoxin reductase